ncbi:MAG: polysaccharide lyase family 7 protein [Acidimicrobiales bacterium]
MRRNRAAAAALVSLLVATGAAGLTAAPSVAATIPASILDLQNWKLEQPTGSSTNATVVSQPELAMFVADPWFVSTTAGDAVRFRAPVACTARRTGPSCGSRSSTNTSYARSELQETTAGTNTRAAWSMATGTHTLEVRLAFTTLPADKPHVVGMQIHDALDDVTAVRLEGKKLWATQGDNTHFKLLKSKYRLGKVVTVKYVASGGKIRVFYNGTAQATIPSSATGNFFKTGAYTQANCDNSSPCDGTVNYGEVQIYSIKVTHL